MNKLHSHAHRMCIAACAAVLLSAAAIAGGGSVLEIPDASFMDSDTGFTFSPPAGCVFFGGRPRPGQIGRFVNANRSVSMSVSYEDLGFRPVMRSHLDRTVKVVRSRFKGLRVVGSTVFRVGSWPAGQWVGTIGSGVRAATHVQLILQTTPRRLFLLTLRRAGVDTRKALAIMNSVRQSIAFTNPEDLAVRRAEAILAAKETLAVASTKLQRIELPEDRWMTLRRNGNDIGFIGLRVERARIDERDGYRLVFRAHTELDGQATLIERTVETTADLSQEWWIQQVTIQSTAGGKTDVATTRTQTGYAGDGRSRVVHRQGRRNWVQEGPTPENFCTMLVAEVYRRLIDPTERRVHTFTRYDPDARRTLPMSLRAEGTKEAVPGGGEGFRFLQVHGNGLPATKIWTDAFGRDLRYEAAGGVVAVRTTRGDVLRRWGRMGSLRVLPIERKQDQAPLDSREHAPTIGR